MIEDISKAIKSILDLTKQLLSARKDRRDDTMSAIRQVREAAAKTRAYMADVEAFPEKSSREKESELMSLWLNAGSSIYFIDQELGDKCMMKADGWSDSRLWKSERYKHVALDLETIVINCENILRDA